MALTLTVALFIGACAEGTVSSARFVDSVSGVRVEYMLTATHAFLGEYDRRLRVEFARSRVDYAMEKDSGGLLLLNIHRLPEGRLMLYDGSAHIIIDAERETVVHTNPPADAAAAEYVGCFDSPRGDGFRFIPSSERPEQKPPLAGTR